MSLDSHQVARLSVLLAAVCFGTTGTALGLGPDSTTPVAVGAARIVLGGALLVVIAVVARRRAGAVSLRSVLAADRRIYAGAGVCVAVYQLTFFAAVHATGVAVGTVVAIGSGPAFAGAFGWLAARESPGRRWAVATALACCGVAVLVLAGGGASVSVDGVLLALCAGAGYAAYTVTSKQLLRRGRSPADVMAGAFGAGAIVLTPVLAATGGPWLGTAGGLALVVFLAVVPTAFAYVLFARGLDRLTAGETATLTLAEPLTAATLGAVVLGERPSAVALLGAVLVLLGLLMLALPKVGAGLEQQH